MLAIVGRGGVGGAVRGECCGLGWTVDMILSSEALVTCTGDETAYKVKNMLKLHSYTVCYQIVQVPWFFFSSSWLTNVYKIKDLWCSSTVRLLSTQIRMEGSVVL